MSGKNRLTTEMIIPVSKETYFNTKWKPPVSPLCAYDMLFHPPDYNPKAARSDRTQQELIRKNIWIQEYHKGIPSTTHFQHGRPKWKPYDLPNKQYTRAIYKNENEHMRINYVLEWTSLVSEGKPDHCIQ